VKRWTTMGCALATMLAMAGCGGGGTAVKVSDAAVATSTGASASKAPAGATDIVAALGAKTAEAKSASIAVSVGMDVAGIPGAPSKPVTVSGQGSFDYGAKRGTLHLDLSNVPGTNGISALDMVLDGATAYVKVPDGLLSSTGGKHWAKVNPGAAGASLDLSQIQQFADPNFALQFLQGFKGGEVKTVGHETIRGTDTTHYQVIIDPANLPSDQSSSGLNLGALTGGLKLPADVWVDADGRMRKFAISMDLSGFFRALLAGFAGSGSGSGPASTVPSNFHFAISVGAEMWDFGQPVTVTVPDPSDVADVASIPGLGGDMAHVADSGSASTTTNG